MSEMLNIEERLHTNELVVNKKENPIIYVGILVASVALGVYSLFIGSGESTAFFVLFVAVVLAAIGLKGLFLPRKILKYGPTGEKLVKQEFYYDGGERKEVDDCLKSKGFEMLKLLPHGKGTTLRVILYSTASGSYSVAQLQQYVPYEYKPVYDVE